MVPSMVPSPRWAALWLLLAHHTLAVPRIVPLLHGWHFDNLIRDSVAPPPALVVFYGSSWCQEAFNGFGLDERRLPTRAHLFVGTYDIDRIDDVWWVGEPRLERRFNLTRYPAAVFLRDPRGSPGDFEVWDGGDEPWLQWAWARLAFDVAVTNGGGVEAVARVAYGAGAARPPEPGAILGAPTLLNPGETATLTGLPGAALEATVAGTRDVLFRAPELSRPDGAACASADVAAPSPFRAPADLRDADAFLNKRDQDTTFSHAATLRQPPVMPDFGVSAYELVPMPEELARVMRAFYAAHDGDRYDEEYPRTSTGINRHVAKTTMVSFDLEPDERVRIATELVQPLVEAWAGMPLVHTSFYGIREYPNCPAKWASVVYVLADERETLCRASKLAVSAAPTPRAAHAASFLDAPSSVLDVLSVSDGEAAFDRVRAAQNASRHVLVVRASDVRAAPRAVVVAVVGWVLEVRQQGADRDTLPSADFFEIDPGVLGRALDGREINPAALKAPPACDLSDAALAAEPDLPAAWAAVLGA